MIKVPRVPLSALVFYLVVILLWNLRIIPPPNELVGLLEKFYQHYGYLGLVLATLFEGISYICLYVPGAFIIALTVFFSDRSLISLVTISAIVSMVLTLDAFINYRLGRYLAARNVGGKGRVVDKSTKLRRGFMPSMLHPNFLAFYFLNAGLKGRSSKQIFYVPLFMFPYGLFIAFLLSSFSGPVRQSLESPTFMLTVLIVWLLVTFLVENKKAYLRD